MRLIVNQSSKIDLQSIIRLFKKNVDKSIEYNYIT